VSERQRVLTPWCHSGGGAGRAGRAAQADGDFDRVSVGFPGVVKHGATFGAFNLHPLWARASRCRRSSKALQEACPLGNDADVPATAPSRPRRGAGTYAGNRLGRGALHQRPSLPGWSWPPSLAQEGMTYEDYLGRRGLDKFGKARWNGLHRGRNHTDEALFNWTTSTSAAATPKRSSSRGEQCIHRLQRERPAGRVVLWRDQA